MNLFSKANFKCVFLLSLALFFSGFFTLNNNVLADDVPGCTDSAALNYDELATVDDGIWRHLLPLTAQPHTTWALLRPSRSVTWS